MRLHNYLEDVLGSRVKVKVIRELFKYSPKPFTGRELASSIKDVTHTGVRKSLADLQSANIIKIEHHGQSSLITLNTKSVVYDALVTLFGKESETFSHDFIYELKKAVPSGAVSCAVFGSVARGAEKPDSDIDVLFVTDNEQLVHKFVEDKLQAFVSRYGNAISPYIMSKAEFARKKNTAFVRGVLENYKLVKGEDLWKLIP